MEEGWARARPDNPLVQILVAVVITDVRPIWTEVENGYRLRAIRSVLVDPKRFVQSDNKGEEFSSSSLNRKGKWLKFHYFVRGWQHSHSGLFLAATQLKDETKGGSESRVFFSV